MKMFRSFFGFFLRVAIVHVVTYVVIGALSYVLIARNLWVGPDAVPGLRDPTGEIVTRWMLPAQILRSLLLAVALYPLRRAFMELGRCGGLVIASLLVIIGSIGGVGGLIESVVYTEDVPLGLVLAHLPEVLIQALLFGYLLLWWERKVESKVSERRRATTQGAS
jgi:hypothetical protein